MSLVFMTAANCVLFLCARRLFGYWSALTSAGLFAGLGLTQDLGVYGTYDAMAILLMSLATYCALRTGEREQNSASWLLLVPIAILAANATKYMTVVFDPVIIALAALQLNGKSRILYRFVGLCAATGGLLLLAVALAGEAYVHGIMFTTIARKSGLQQFLAGSSIQSLHFVLSESWHWVGLVVLICAASLVAAAARKRKKEAAILTVLMVAGILITLEAIHLHSDQSMRKHDDFGAWFACMGTGVIPAYVRSAIKGRYGLYLTVATMGSVVILPGTFTTPDALLTYPPTCCTGLEDASAVLKPYLQEKGRYLIGGINNEAILYWDHSPSRWYENFDDIYIKYPIPGAGGDSHGQVLGKACSAMGPHCMYLEGPAGYRAAIHAHWLALISLVGGHVIGHHKMIHQDDVIEQAVEHTRGYVLLTRVGGAPTWIYRPDYRKFLDHLHHH